MPIYNPRWDRLGSFNSGGASSFMANAGRNLSIATDTSIYKDRAKQDFFMYQTKKKEEFDAQTGDIIARIMNGQEPEAINGNFDHKAVALAITEKKKVDYNHARDLLQDKHWELKYKNDVDYKKATLKLQQNNLNETSRHNRVSEDVSRFNSKEKQRINTLNYNLGVGRIKEQIRKDTLNYNLGVNRLNEQSKESARNYNLSVSRLNEQAKNNARNYNLGVGRLNEQQAYHNAQQNLSMDRFNETKRHNNAIEKQQEQRNVNDIYKGKITPPDVYSYSSGYVTKDVVTHKAGSYTDEGKKTLDMIHLKEKDRNRFLSLSKDEQKKEAKKYWQKIANDKKSSPEQVDYAKKVLGEKNLFDKTVETLNKTLVGFSEASDNFKADIYGFFTKDSTKEETKQQIKKYYDRTRKELGISSSPTGNAVNEYMRAVIEKPLDELTSNADKQKYYENVVEKMRVPASKVELATDALKNAINNNADSQTIEKLKGFLYSAKEEAKKQALEFATKVKLENMKKKNRIEEIGYRYQTNKKILDYKKKLKQDD